MGLYNDAHDNYYPSINISIMSDHKPFFSAHGNYYLIINRLRAGRLRCDADERRAIWKDRLDDQPSARILDLEIHCGTGRRDPRRAKLVFPGNRSDSFTVRNFVSARSGCFEREYCSFRIRIFLYRLSRDYKSLDYRELCYKCYLSKKQDEVLSLLCVLFYRRPNYRRKCNKHVFCEIRLVKRVMFC